MTGHYVQISRRTSGRAGRSFGMLDGCRLFIFDGILRQITAESIFEVRRRTLVFDSRKKGNAHYLYRLFAMRQGWYTCGSGCGDFLGSPFEKCAKVRFSLLGIGRRRWFERHAHTCVHVHFCPNGESKYRQVDKHARAGRVVLRPIVGTVGTRALETFPTKNRP